MDTNLESRQNQLITTDDTEARTGVDAEAGIVNEICPAGPGPALLAGYSSWTVSEITELIKRGGNIGVIPGDFVVGDPSPEDGWAITSCVSAIPWYWAHGLKGEFVQGSNVFDVAKRAGIPWKWNQNAIQCLALYGHTLGADTLHPGVNRLLPSSKVWIEGGCVHTKELDYWGGLEWDKTADPDSALDILKQSFLDCGPSDGMLLSLSSGYDSRVLLALCASYGITPRLAVMGFADTTDVVVAKKLADVVGMPIDIVPILAADYLVHGETIALVTSGVKTAANWHTWLYGLGIKPKGKMHFVGSNGEFARSFFLDSPGLHTLTKRMPGSVAEKYFLAKLVRRYLKFSRHNHLARDGGLQNVIRLSGLVRGEAFMTGFSLLPTLDLFYARSRVRHFIGAGLACYSDYSSPRSPFLDGRWIRAVAGLFRALKDRSQYHRYCIERLSPNLLSLPFNAPLDGGVMVGYSPFSDLVAERSTRDLIVESKELDHLITRDDRVRIVEDKRCDHAEEFSFFLMLHYASMISKKSSSNLSVSRKTP